LVLADIEKVDSLLGIDNLTFDDPLPFFALSWFVFISSCTHITYNKSWNVTDQNLGQA
jgi:hypothetical protein